jgi:hypothetical protein
VKKPGRLGWLLLPLLAVLIVKQRLYSRDEPLESDTSLFSVLAAEWNQGRLLYSDIWDNKPPGIILTYAGAQSLAGSGQRSILLLGSAASILTMVGIYFAVFALTKNTGASLWGAVFWTITNANPYLEANQPLAEVFVNVCWIWAAAWGFYSRERRSTRNLLWAGSFLALATFYKHHLIFANIPFALGIALADQKTAGRTKSIWQSVLWLALPSVLLWTATFGYFAFDHRFQSLWEMLVTHSRFYAVSGHPGQSGPFSNFLDSMNPSLWWNLAKRGVFHVLLPMLVGSLPAVILAIRLKERRWLVWFGYILAAWIGLSIPGRFFSHYFQILLPPLIIGSAASASMLTRWAGDRDSRLARLWPAALAALLLFRELPFYRLNPEEWSKLKYGTVYTTTRKMGEELGRHLPPGESFYELGCEPGLYYYSGRRPPVGILMSTHWDEGPLREGFMNRIQNDLAKSNPLLLVTTQFWLSSESRLRLPLAQWLFNRYDPLPKDPQQWPFVLFVRRDCPLKTRQILAHSD